MRAETGTYICVGWSKGKGEFEKFKWERRGEIEIQIIREKVSEWVWERERKIDRQTDKATERQR